MKKATLVVSPTLNNNQIFDPKCFYNFDGLLYPYTRTKEKFAEHGVDLATQDIHPPKDSDYVLYMEVPKELPTEAEADKSFLLLGEPETVMPHNWILSKHARFKKVFTFCDNYVDGKKYIKLNLSRPFKDEVPTDLSEKTNFCALIAGNKFSKHPSELYSARRSIIRWFEKNHPEQFDLFGLGWDKQQFRGIFRPFNRVPMMRKLFAPHYPSYRGIAGRKFDLLRTYKFSITFENGYGIPGYVTGDKIFESMQAGCVPVYWGAPNVTDYVPAGCFIDMRNFKNWEELYAYMNGMSDADYQKYLENIKAFILAEKYGPFSAEYFANTLVREILGVKEEAMTHDHAVGQ